MFIEIAAAGQTPDKKAFNIGVAHLVGYLMNFFKKVRIPGCKALKMVIVDSKPDLHHLLPAGSVSPIFFYYCQYDYRTNYLSKDNVERKHEVVKLIKILTEAVSGFMDVDYEVFSDAILSIEGLSGIFKEKINRPKKSPNKKLEIFIERTNESDGASYDLVLRNLKDRSERILHLFTSNLDGGLMAGYGPTSLASDGEWKSDEFYEVRGRTNDIAFLCDVMKMTAEVELRPSRPQDLEWVQSKFEINTTTDDERKLHLARKFSK